MNSVSDHIILKAIPALNKIYQSDSILNYFNAELGAFNFNDQTVEKDILTDCIYRAVHRLYGAVKADAVRAQFQKMSVVETGTHLSFLRDYDNIEKDSLRSRLNQNVIISAALMERLGQKYHIGLYGSNVALSSSCSGGYFQLGDDLFPVNGVRLMQQAPLYKAPAISSEYAHVAVIKIAQFKMLAPLLDQNISHLPDSPEKNLKKKIQNILNQIIVASDSPKNNPANIGQLLDRLNPVNRQQIDQMMNEFNSECQKKYHRTFDDVEKEYQSLKKIFDLQNVSLSHQVALIQNNQINQILDGMDIEQISLDGFDIGRDFFAQALKNPNSVWYKIFSDDKMMQKFQQGFIGIRGSWKEGEAPFDYVASKKDYVKINPLPVKAMVAQPQTLADALDRGEIVPSCALLMMGFQSALTVAHGGYFQTVYSSKIKKSFCHFLSEAGMHGYSKKIEPISADIALLSLSAMNDDDHLPMKLSEIARMNEADRLRWIRSVPDMSGQELVKNALPVLNTYLNKMAPGYLEKEAGTAVQKITQHLSPIIQRVDDKIKKR